MSKKEVVLHIRDLKDMLNQTKELYKNKPAYKITDENKKYFIVSEYTIPTTLTGDHPVNVTYVPKTYTVTLDGAEISVGINTTVDVTKRYTVVLIFDEDGLVSEVKITTNN